MTIYDDAEAGTEDINRLANALTQVDSSGRTLVDRLRDAMEGHPRAASYDSERSSGRLWCWEHEQDLARCHRDDMQCSGESLTGPSDPTGEAAMRADKAAADLKRLTNIFAKLRSEADAGMRIANAYTPRQATAAERQRTADWNAPHCEQCCKVNDMVGGPQWVEPLTKERTTVTDLIDQAMWLCRWCYDHVVVCEGILPNEAELEQHRDGKRIVCPHPRKKAA